jgi:tetratricopeptide (TPR) repeat protein
MRRTTALGVLMILALAGSAFAGSEGRIAGKVIDGATGKPIANASIHVSAIESRKVEQDFKTDKDGTYRVFLVDATIRYKFTVTAPDHAAYVETVKLNIGDTMTKDFTLNGPVAAPTPAAPKAADPSVTAYNDGAKLYNDSKYPEAVAKFEEAVKGKPDLVAGWEALARAALKIKEYPKAIEAATKALDQAPDESDMFGVLFEAYTATGDKAKAAEWKKKMPVDAAGAFNAAVALLNKNNDAEAEPLLKQAIAADEKFAPAHFELGMVYLRAGKMAEAKTSLETYLKLDPKGKDAETAKETLKYLK